jgi:hypothetical protein
MDSTVPTTATLFNYDANRDAFPGIVVKKGGSGQGENNPERHQTWRLASRSSPTTISGDVGIALWSGTKEFKQNKRGVVTIYLRDFSGSSYTEIGSVTIDRADWQEGSATWVLNSVAIPVSTYVLPAGHSLELKVIVPSTSQEDMWFAYDTTAYRSHIRWPASGATGTSETTTFVASADAYVHSGSPGHNHGTNKEMTINPKLTDINRAYLRFNLASIPPSVTIEDAQLILCPKSDNDNATGRIHELRRVSSDWGETTLTWSNQPTVETVSAGVMYDGVMSCLNWTVTADIQIWVNGTPNYGWTLRDAAELLSFDAKVDYFAREETNGALGPFLVVTYIP